jgi:hypothetical protein
MSNFSEDDIRRAAEVREWLVKEVTNKKDELEKLRNTLLIVDSLLKKTSFISASNLESPSPNFKNKGTQQFQSNHGEEEEEDEITQQETRMNSVEESQREDRQNDSQGVQVRSLKRAKDNLLISNAEYTATSVRIALVDDINLNVNTPPFKTFFLNRILEGMRTKDKEKVQKGELDESEIIDYKVDNDEKGKINSVMISNYRERERLNEIFNTATWVFTRMLEKEKGN